MTTVTLTPREVDEVMIALIQRRVKLEDAYAESRYSLSRTIAAAQLAHTVSTIAKLKGEPTR